MCARPGFWQGMTGAFAFGFVGVLLAFSYGFYSGHLVVASTASRVVTVKQDVSDVGYSAQCHRIRYVSSIGTTEVVKGSSIGLPGIVRGGAVLESRWYEPGAEVHSMWGAAGFHGRPTQTDNKANAVTLACIGIKVG